jgi:nitrogen fixation protein NifB
MRHCTRCRADAVGLLGEATPADLLQTLSSCSNLVPFKPAKSVNLTNRPCVAVASQEGVLVNQHLGEAHQILIYKEENGEVEMVDQRVAPEPGSKDRRWQILSKTLSDCRALLVSGIGEKPKKILSSNGIEIIEVEGMITDAVRAVYKGESLRHLAVRKASACGAGCGGNAMGCG